MRFTAGDETKRTQPTNGQLLFWFRYSRLPTQREQPPRVIVGDADGFQVMTPRHARNKLGVAKFFKAVKFRDRGLHNCDEDLEINLDFDPRAEYLSGRKGGKVKNRRIFVRHVVNLAH